MSFIAGWISNIIIFVLLATVIDMLLPNSAFQKYAKMVIGLLLIAVIITPIIGLFHTDFDRILSEATSEFKDQQRQEDLGNLTEKKKKEIQAAQGAYILEQIGSELRSEVEEELIEDYHMKISSIDVGVHEGENPSQETLEHIRILLEETEGDGEETAIEAVAKITIDTGESTAGTEEKDSAAIKEFLADRWSVDEDIIEIAGERSGKNHE